MKNKYHLFSFLILFFIVLPNNTIGQSLDNLDKVTGYKNFTFNSPKSTFKNYNLKVYDDGYSGFEKEYGTDPYIILNYNGKIGEFDIPYIILHFISQKLTKVTLGIDGDIYEVQKFLNYTFGEPNKNNTIDKSRDLLGPTGGIAEWEGSKISLEHSMRSLMTIPASSEHHLVFSLKNYDSIKEKNKQEIYEKAFEDFSNVKPQEKVASQSYNIGDKIDNIPSYFELLGVSSKDNSKIYRLKVNFPTTSFSYKVDKFEIKVWNNTIVTLHFVLFPKDTQINIVPLDLLEKIKAKSGTTYFQKESKFYFDENEVRTVVFRESLELYEGDRIHISVISSDYLYQ
jgi:hypothetical protein